MAEPKGSSEPIDTRLVRRLADILNATDLTEIEVERGDLKVRVARQLTVAAAAPLSHTIAAAPALTAAAPTPAAQAVSPMTSDPAAPPPRVGETIKSPMVGTVFLAPQPGAAPFVNVGDRVEQGQTLLIIEAMKTMNPIPAPRAGTVLEFLITNEQPVEYGEPLVVIE